MKKYLLLAIIALSFAPCGAQSVGTRGAQYPQMYEENPASIVIMPPINKTNSVEAKEFFYTTLYMPLCEKGYYVFSPYLTMEMLQSESAYDSEMFLESSISSFQNILGADAAMFTVIKSWDKDAISGLITVGVEYILRSTNTGNTLYEKEGLVKLDTNVEANTGGGLLGTLASMAATAINTALTDKVIVGRKCTALVLSDMPVGKYNTNYGKDSSLPAKDRLVSATIR